MSKLTRIIAHWTAGSYNVSAVDKQHYHFVYDGDGNEVAGKHKPEDNISAADEIYGAHTRSLNTGSIGVSVACMAGAQEGRTNGRFPMTEKQFDAMCKGIARLCKQYNIPVTPRTVLSHAEVQPTLGVRQRGKWDFTVLPFMPHLRGHKACGDEMRKRVRRYLGDVQIADPAPSGGPDERVAWLQRLLREEGYDIMADGWEGPKTAEAVRTFEQFHGLPVTGSLSTPATVHKLRSNAENRRPDRAVIEEVAATDRVSRSEMSSIAAGALGITGTASQVISAAEEATSLTERVFAMGPWVIAAVAIAGFCYFLWRDRRNKKKAARFALQEMDV